MTDLQLTIPLIPVSVNEYKQKSRHGHWYVTKEAQAYKDAIAIIARRQTVEGKKYQVDVVIYLGKKQKLDHDNGWKVIGDGLKEAGVIQSDAWIKASSTRMERDWDNPRTEIRIRTL